MGPDLSGVENDGLIAIRDERYCCDKEEVEVHGKCCNKTKCTCDPTLCPSMPKPKCEKIDEIHDIVDPLACCKEWICKCPPKEDCPPIEKPADLEVGEEVVLDETRCCPFYIKKCSNKCPADP